MKYKLEKIKSISAVNNWHGLRRENAKSLANGETVELEDAPKSLVDG